VFPKGVSIASNATLPTVTKLIIYYFDANILLNIEIRHLKGSFPYKFMHKIESKPQIIIYPRLLERFF
ncbi:MAG TPA: hypothetical protein VKY37_02990, partial [Brumimicrobium sp.]|nr:hypothetical protein [Brumimicrobium sp.]